MADASLDLALYSAALLAATPPAIIRPFLNQLADGKWRSIDDLQKQCQENDTRLQAHLRKCEICRKELQTAFTLHPAQRRHVEIIDKLIMSLEARAARDEAEKPTLVNELKRSLSTLFGATRIRSKTAAIQRKITAQIQAEEDELAIIMQFLRDLRYVFGGQWQHQRRSDALLNDHIHEADILE